MQIVLCDLFDNNLAGLDLIKMNVPCHRWRSGMTGMVQIGINVGSAQLNLSAGNVRLQTSLDKEVCTEFTITINLLSIKVPLPCRVMGLPLGKLTTVLSVYREFSSFSFVFVV